MLTVIKIVVAIIGALVPIYFGVKIWKTNLYLPVAAGVALATIANVWVDCLGLKFSDPSVKVQITSIKNDELLIAVSKKEKMVEFLDIDVPIFGKVVNIHDLSSNVDRRSVEKIVVGAQTELSQNNVRLTIQGLSAKSHIEFKILIVPPPQKEKILNLIKTTFAQMLPLNLNGRTLEEALWLDRFRYRYTWVHDGNTQEKVKWISLQDNKETSPSPMEMLGFNLKPYAMTSEDVTKSYQQSIGIHKF